MNVIDRNTVNGMMTEGERITTETTTTGEERTTTMIVTIVTTTQIITEGETTEGTRKEKCTQNKIDGTQNMKGTRTIDATTKGEIFAEKSIKNRPESTVGNQIQV